MDSGSFVLPLEKKPWLVLKSILRYAVKLSLFDAYLFYLNRYNFLWNKNIFRFFEYFTNYKVRRVEFFYQIKRS